MHFSLDEFHNAFIMAFDLQRDIIFTLEMRLVIQGVLNFWVWGLGCRLWGADGSSVGFWGAHLLHSCVCKCSHVGEHYLFPHGKAWEHIFPFKTPLGNMWTTFQSLCDNNCSHEANATFKNILGNSFRMGTCLFMFGEQCYIDKNERYSNLNCLLVARN